MVRRHRDENVRNASEGGWIERMIAIEAQQTDMPIRRQRAIRLAAASAGEMPLRIELPRQGPRAVAEAEAQEMTAHGARFSAVAGAWAGGSLSRCGATRRCRAQVSAQTTT